MEGPIKLDDLSNDLPKLGALPHASPCFASSHRATGLAGTLVTGGTAHAENTAGGRVL